MKIRTLLLLIVLLAISAFAALNWNVLVTPTELSLGITSVQAPLGLVMLGLLVLLTVLFLIFILYLQTTVLLDTRRHTRELHANRELADQAEASRFTELRSYMEMSLKQQAELDAEAKADVLARLERLDADFHTALAQSENTLAAYIGELEDRVERGTHILNPQSAP
ncbi:LapA family protein [Sulfuriferula nivalis]|uniref:Signal transduction histidine kinase n=1 Tax=Sulfuriferula nivalis TaxID=2675298 RepID=A0A809REZ9_9PROT|nr:LapA family protein [Sulfuriferula nivalis]BBP00206.1 hypothetical protein SFSGTM_09140 [Sulfuriferula nivalis]